ncbi:MAG: galactose mutarotase [Bacteroidales bacterium]|nr:galactose mutarotase [Bacteroidales bacterium]
MKIRNLMIAAATTAAMICSCNDKSTKNISGIDASKFETTYTDALRGEKAVHLYTLRNANGMEVCITNFGGRIVSLMVPDREGKMRDVVLGFDNAQDFFPENHSSDFGAIIGRYANRLNQGRIVVDGDTIQLPQNNGPHCLHGGTTGWQYQVYDAEQKGDNQLRLTQVSPDGDNNFPGTMNVSVVYTLTDDNAIEINYEATTDRRTVINMTNHAYFNLNADGSTTILNHLLTIDADSYTPVDSTFITTGEIATVEGTPMDFRKAKEVGKDIDNYDFQQLKNGNGYDHNWVLNTRGDASRPCARLVSPLTGIALEVYTTEPGMQVYTGNFLDGTVIGKQGIAYPQRSAICLETQKYPDSPNKQWDESNAYLNPGETYRSYCKFKFSVEK